MSPNEQALLLALRRGNHFKNSPGNPRELLGINVQDAHPAGRHLITLGYAARVIDSERPAALLLRITDAGVSVADQILHAKRKLTLWERVKALPIGKGIWDILKVGLGVVLGVLGKKFFGS